MADNDSSRIFEWRDWAGWRVEWRVVAPGAGLDGRDWIAHKGPEPADAVDALRYFRGLGWGVRLERVSLGPFE